jgi:anti-sigma B factor antagonist
MAEITPSAHRGDADRPVLLVSGDLDHGDAGELREAGFAAVDAARAGAPVTVDLADVAFADSTSLGALVEIRAYADEHGRRLLLTNVPPRIVQLLTLSGLDAVFTFEQQPREVS